MKQIYLVQLHARRLTPARAAVRTEQYEYAKSLIDCVGKLIDL